MEIKEAVWIDIDNYSFYTYTIVFDSDCLIFNYDDYQFTKNGNPRKQLIIPYNHIVKIFTEVDFFEYSFYISYSVEGKKNILTIRLPVQKKKYDFFIELFMNIGFEIEEPLFNYDKMEEQKLLADKIFNILKYFILVLAIITGIYCSIKIIPLIFIFFFALNASIYMSPTRKFNFSKRVGKIFAGIATFLIILFQFFFLPYARESEIIAMSCLFSIIMYISIFNEFIIGFLINLLDVIHKKKKR